MNYIIFLSRAIVSVFGGMVCLFVCLFVTGKRLRYRHEAFGV